MKVCEICNDEIGTKDGENRCTKHQDTVKTPKKAKQKRLNEESILRSFGLVKVRGAMGGTYWE